MATTWTSLTARRAPTMARASITAGILALVGIAGMGTAGCTSDSGDDGNGGIVTKGSRIFAATNVDVLGTTTDDAIVYADKTNDDVRAIDAETLDTAVLNPIGGAPAVAELSHFLPALHFAVNVDGDAVAPDFRTLTG